VFLRCGWLIKKIMAEFSAYGAMKEFFVAKNFTIYGLFLQDEILQQ